MCRKVIEIQRPAFLLWGSVLVGNSCCISNKSGQVKLKYLDMQTPRFLHLSTQPRGVGFSEKPLCNYHLAQVCQYSLQLNVYILLPTNLEYQRWMYLARRQVSYA